MEARLLSHVRALSRYAHLLPWAALAGLSILIIGRAWVAEDAYITFRVIDNFLRGYGLRWNIYERVQAYTHPLWMLLHIPLVAVLTNIFYANILLSLSCTLGALWLTLRYIQRPAALTLLCFLLPLFLSRAFMDYSTSGLENPLTFLMFAVFGHVLLNYRQYPRFWLYASLSIALAAFNRLDSALLYVPAACYLLRGNFRQVPWRQVTLGMLPLAGWLAFSLFYYGFIFPNTKYAKLNTDIGWLTYLSEGLEYLKYFIMMDLPSFLTIMLAACMALPAAKGKLAAPVDMPWLPRALGLGVLLYSAYIICVGGDYMAGRFWAAPTFASAWMLLAFCPPQLRKDVKASFVVALLAARFVSGILFDIHAECEKCLSLEGKIIEATEVFKTNRLIPKTTSFRIRSEGEYVFAERGRMLARQAAADPENIWRLNLVGMTGYYAGAKTPIIDTLGLADPLLARLPAIKEENFFIGHYHRDIPAGYTRFLRSGSPELMDPNLAGYYTPLHLIVSGDLLDTNRLETIILFNLGYYDHFKNAYLNHLKP